MKKNAPNQELVTTEPQRRALEAMSEDLVRKLNLMVAEQEARAREFANHQHSLSSLPEQQQPQVEAYIPKPYQRQAEFTPPPPPQQREYRQYQTTQQAEEQHQPYFPSSQHVEVTTRPPFSPTQPHYEKRLKAAKQPTVIRKKENQQEEGVSATAIIVILLILFSILSRTCS